MFILMITVKLPITIKQPNQTTTMNTKPNMQKVRAAVGLPPLPNMQIILARSRQTEAAHRESIAMVPDKVKPSKRPKPPVDAARRKIVRTTGKSCSGFCHSNFNNLK
jgi:hypothetical protein